MSFLPPDIELDDTFGVTAPPSNNVVNNPDRTATLRRREARHHARATKRAEHLNDLIGPLLPGDSWHIISTGDIDSGSFLELLIARHGPFEHAYISTWRIAREYINRLRAHLEAKRLGTFTAFTGDYFAARYPADYTALSNLADQYGGRVYRWQNHAKMFALRNDTTNFCCVVETSANMTGNPRTEQTVIHIDENLYIFFRDWFEDAAHERNQYRLPD